MLAPSAICVTGGKINTETMLKVEEEGMFLTVRYALYKQGFAGKEQKYAVVPESYPQNARVHELNFFCRLYCSTFQFQKSVLSTFFVFKQHITEQKHKNRIN